MMLYCTPWHSWCHSFDMAIVETDGAVTWSLWTMEGHCQPLFQLWSCGELGFSSILSLFFFACSLLYILWFFCGEFYVCWHTLLWLNLLQPLHSHTQLFTKVTTWPGVYKGRHLSSVGKESICGVETGIFFFLVKMMNKLVGTYCLTIVLPAIVIY